MSAVNEPRCATCIYWMRGAPSIAHAIRDPGQAPDVGACQAAPPELRRLSTFAVESFFPVVHADRFCAMWTGERCGDDPEREDIPEPRASVISLETRRAA